MDMGTVVAVKKNGVICIAADSLTISGGSRKQTANYVIDYDKIIRYGTSYIGTASHPAWHIALKTYFSEKKGKFSLNSREEIFNELLVMHRALKEDYLLIPHEHEDDEFESIRFESLIINPGGIFKTYKLRSVQQFLHFSAIGSGSSYALGALYALYDRLDSAEEIAREALSTAVEFDDSSALPGTFYKVKSK